MPGQPASWIGVQVLAVAQIEHLALERHLGLGVGSCMAELALENHSGHRHRDK
jgi:hypothetical protein